MIHILSWTELHLQGNKCSGIATFKQTYRTWASFLGLFLSLGETGPADVSWKLLLTLLGARIILSSGEIQTVTFRAVNRRSREISGQ